MMSLSKIVRMASFAAGLLLLITPLEAYFVMPFLDRFIPGSAEVASELRPQSLFYAAVGAIFIGAAILMGPAKEGEWAGVGYGKHDGAPTPCAQPGAQVQVPIPFCTHPLTCYCRGMENTSPSSNPGSGQRMSPVTSARVASLVVLMIVGGALAVIRAVSASPPSFDTFPSFWAFVHDASTAGLLTVGMFAAFEGCRILISDSH